MKPFINTFGMTRPVEALFGNSLGSRPSSVVSAIKPTTVEVVWPINALLVNDQKPWKLENIRDIGRLIRYTVEAVVTAL
jgi:hypothetical protein